MEEGLVVRVTGKEAWVLLGEELIICALRGKLRRSPGNLGIVAGDMVSVSRLREQRNAGTLEAQLPRKSLLSRLYGRKERREKAIVANLDLLFLITSLKDPYVDYGFVDRVLVSAERGNVKVCICLNKIDITGADRKASDFVAAYESCGYQVILTSAVRGDGIETIREMLSGGIYAFVGASGVGKSSILMKLDPELNLKVADLTSKTKRGRHTTSYSQLYRLKGGFVADTPGIQTFGFPGSDKVELADCFPEFAKVAGECKFQPCTHSHEPGCAVKAARDKGAIGLSRYRSYLNMLAELELRERRRFS